MQKNVGSQYWYVFAFDRTDNTAKTGDAAQITGDLFLDGGAANAIDDANPTELGHGYYRFDITQAESNADQIMIDPVSSTGDIQVVGVPGSLFTTAPNFNVLGIEADGDVTKCNLVAVTTENTDMVGTDGANTVEPDPAGTAAVPGDAMNLAADAIKAVSFDESTAFPLKANDAGATAVARTGADGDTLEDISDEIAALNDLSAAQAEAACDASLVTYDGPTHAEMTAEHDVLEGEHGAINSNIDDNGTAIAALNDLSASDVNDEVVDVLETDTHTEVGQEAPAATQSFLKMVQYLYKFLRNKKTQTATTFSVYDDAGTTVDQKSTDSDDGTTTTKGEIVSGP